MDTPADSHLNTSSTRRRHAVRAWRRLCGLALVATLIVGPLGYAAGPVDLTYPPPGAAAPVVNVDAGQTNTGVRLTPAEAEARAKRYAHGHLIIDGEFEVILPPAPASPTKPTPDKKPAASKKPTAQIHHHRKPAATAHEIGLLWRVKRTGDTASYVFGTVHSEDPRVLAIPSPVKKIFDHSSSFTAEIMLDRAEPGAFNTAMVFDDGRTLASVAGSRLAKQTAALLAARNIPARVAELMKPMAAATLLSVPKPKTGDFLDESLFHRAKRENKPVYGLETPTEQFASLNTIPMREQVALLREAVQEYPHLQSMIDRIINVYLSRNLTRLVQLEHEFDAQNPRAAAAFSNAVITQRNKRMVKRMLPRLAQGNAFIAIGALHLPGPQGVLQLLRDRGFTVTAVY